MTRNITKPYEGYYCNRADETSWNAVVAGGAGFFTIPSGATVEGWKTRTNDDMIIYTTDQVYILTGNTPPDILDSGISPFMMSEHLNSINFIAPYGIVNALTHQFFFNNKSIVNIASTRSGGNIANAIISNKIRSRLDTINETYHTKIYGYYLANKYNFVLWYLPLESGTDNNHLMILDLDTGGFYPCENRGATCVCQLEDGTVLTGHADGSIKEEFTGNTVDGSNYDFEWRTGWIDFGKENVSLTDLQIVNHQTSNYPLIIDIYKDFSDYDKKNLYFIPDRCHAYRRIRRNGKCLRNSYLRR